MRLPNLPEPWEWQENDSEELTAERTDLHLITNLEVTKKSLGWYVVINADDTYVLRNYDDGTTKWFPNVTRAIVAAEAFYMTELMREAARVLREEPIAVAK